MITIEKHPTMRKAYRLTCQLHLPVSRDEVFEFFSDAYQLERITPPWLNFSVLTPRPLEMKAGALIDYKLHLHRFPLKWRTKITEWEPPFHFTDEQLHGPYKLWRHLHTFEEVNNEVVCYDQVDYAVPGGALVNHFFVKKDLQKIFNYRQQSMIQIFGGQQVTPSNKSEKILQTSS